MIAAILAILIGGQSASGAVTCLGQTPQACRGILAKHVAVSYDNFPATMPKVPEADINGHPVNQVRKLSIWVHLPRDPDYVRRAITLTVGADGLVASATADLAKDLGTAKTESEFVATGLGSIAPAFLPASCDEHEGLSLFRAILDRITPTIGVRRDLWTTVDGGLDSLIFESSEVDICGVSVSYRREYGTSSYRVSSSSSGRFDDREITFKRPLQK